jgi:hypothetical protein
MFKDYLQKQVESMKDTGFHVQDTFMSHRNGMIENFVFPRGSTNSQF